MGPKWRCKRCGHEITESPEAALVSTRVPRCHECETREELYPGGPKIWAALPMEEAGCTA